MLSDMTIILGGAAYSVPSPLPFGRLRRITVAFPKALVAEPPESVPEGKEPGYRIDRRDPESMAAVAEILSAALNMTVPQFEADIPVAAGEISAAVFKVAAAAGLLGDSPQPGEAGAGRG